MDKLDNNCEGDRGSVARWSSQSSLDECGQGAQAAAGGGHAARLLTALDALRHDRHLCDVVLHAKAPVPLPGEILESCEAEGQGQGDCQPCSSSAPDVLEEDDELGIPAHRAVLAASSPYFRAMFTQFDERTKKHITIQGIEPHVLQSIVWWIYAPESLQVREATVQELLAGASLLQVAGVRAAAAAFLGRALQPDNALGIKAFARLHACTELAARAGRYVDRHFLEVSQHDEFLALEPDALSELLSSDALDAGAGGEEAVLDAALRWLAADEGPRLGPLAAVLERVRLPLVPHEALVARARRPPLMRAPAAVKDLIIEALALHLARDRGALSATAGGRTLPRHAPRAPRLLLLVGGQAPKAVRDVEALDPAAGRWAPAKDLPSRRCRAGVAALAGRVYAVGGFNGTLRVRSVDVYDPARDAWAPGPPLCARRSTLGVAVLDGRLYAVGGFDGATGLGTAEVLDPAEGAWRPIADMSTRRSSVGVAALDGCVYAVGGYDGATRQCLASVERFDPATGRWEPVEPMGARRSGAGVGVVGGQLYAVGGHDGPAVRRSVERYCPRGGWRPAPPMRAARRNAAVLALQGRLYVLGGDDGAANLDTVEVFDPATDSWAELEGRMALGRSYAGAALVERVA